MTITTNRKTEFFAVNHAGCYLRQDKSYTSDVSQAAKFPTLEAAIEFARHPKGFPGIHDRTIDEYYRSAGDSTIYMRTAATGIL